MWIVGRISRLGIHILCLRYKLYFSFRIYTSIGETGPMDADTLDPASLESLQFYLFGCRYFCRVVVDFMVRFGERITTRRPIHQKSRIGLYINLPRGDSWATCIFQIVNIHILCLSQQFFHQQKLSVPWKSILTSLPVWATVVAHFSENWLGVLHSSTLRLHYIYTTFTLFYVLQGVLHSSNSTSYIPERYFLLSVKLKANW